MKKLLFTVLCAAALAGCNSRTAIPYGGTVTLSEEVLRDKIKGGWAGQTIGCTFGGPTEFKYKGGIIHDEVQFVWYDDYAWDTFMEDPGLYDDVYMDLTFVEVMARDGIDAPAENYALAFANADYKLWHANQAARYNILHGIMPPASTTPTPTTSISRSKPTSSECSRRACPPAARPCATASATS